MTLKKDKARNLIKIRLANLDQDDYLAASALVYAQVSLFLSGYKSSGELRKVLLYRASPSWREVDLSGLTKDFPDIRFERVPIDAEAKMPDVEYDIIFVPLYGFSGESFRLGHGSGWYDRFLSLQSHTLKIGVGFELNRINFQPDFHDVTMDEIITDRQGF